jgi:tRNA-dihydrouridine synthase B
MSVDVRGQSLRDQRPETDGLLSPALSSRGGEGEARSRSAVTDGLRADPKSPLQLAAKQSRDSPEAAHLDGVSKFEALFGGATPVLALAPMQGVTDLPFWNLLSIYGGADLYFTEYFRVYPSSRLDKHILKSITANPTGKPVVAQMIGNDIPALVRTARELQQYPIVAVDLNLGCPAPVVYRKSAGGGLLRHPPQVDAILGALSEAIAIKFSVKTRLGFESADAFPELLRVFAKHSLDLLTVHGRTVKEMYRSEVHYEQIARAVAELRCPVLANGNVYSARKGEEVLRVTGARGLMIGRGAIRNPWIFEQFRQEQRGERMYVPCGREVLAYVGALYDAVCSPRVRESAQVQKMKKYMNYLGMGAEPTGQFLHEIRRVNTRADFFKVCETFLDHERPMALEPFRLALAAGDVLAGEHG